MKTTFMQLLEDIRHYYLSLYTHIMESHFDVKPKDWIKFKQEKKKKRLHDWAHGADARPFCRDREWMFAGVERKRVKGRGFGGTNP